MKQTKITHTIYSAEVGDKVILNEEDNVLLPEITGKITDIDGDFATIKWSNGESDSYYIDELTWSKIDKAWWL